MKVGSRQDRIYVRRYYDYKTLTFFALAILLVWCISSMPHVFDSKMCTRVDLIRVVHV